MQRGEPLKVALVDEPGNVEEHEREDTRCARLHLSHPLCRRIPSSIVMPKILTNNPGPTPHRGVGAERGLTQAGTVALGERLLGHPPIRSDEMGRAEAPAMWYI